MAVDKIDNFSFFQQNPRVESLSLNKISFNTKNINDLGNIIRNNYKYKYILTYYRHLKIIEFKKITLKSTHFILFIGYLQKIRNLNALVIDYQIFDESIYNPLSILVPKLQYLKYLKIKNSQLSIYFFKFIH